MKPQIGELWRGPDGLGLVTYVNKLGGVTMKINGFSRHFPHGEFVETFEKFKLEY